MPLFSPMAKGVEGCQITSHLVERPFLDVQWGVEDDPDVVGLAVGVGLAEQSDAAGVGLDGAEDRLDGGGLAGPVRTDETHDVARRQ